MTLRTLLCLLVATASAAFGQTYSRPSTFLNIAWGASRAEVIRGVADAGGMVTEATYDNVEPKLEITGGKFAGQEVVTWSLEFVRNKFVAAAVSLKAPEGNTSALYRQLLQELKRKYGPQPLEKKFSTLTAEQRKTYTLNGLRAPNRGTAATWKFVPNLKDKDTLSLTCEHAPPNGSDSADETTYLVTVRYSADSLKTQIMAGAAAADKNPAVRAKDL